jgi:Domain of unknown function (DUF4129)
VSVAGLLPPSALSALLPLHVPVDLDRLAAARAARAELAKQAYSASRPSLSERVLQWVFDHLVDLFDRVASVSPGGFAGVAAVVVVVVIAAIALRVGVGPMRRASSSETPLFVGRARTAADHRSAANANAAEGRWAEAVRDRLRAIITGLEERTLLEPRPGRTADEAAADAGVVVPECAADLHAAARVFDEIWYGSRPADATHDTALRGLDDRVRASRPAIRAPA